MTLTHDDLRPLLTCRVHVQVQDDATHHELILRYLPQNAAVFARLATGEELTIPLETLASVSDARTECPRCLAVVNNIFDTREHYLAKDIPPSTPPFLCADCYRLYALPMPAPVMPCPECGARPAFFSPGDRTYACTPCHGKRKGLTGLGVELRVMTSYVPESAAQAADCRGADTSDLRHRWYNVKGHRYHCEKCHAKRFTDPDDRTLA